MTKGELAEKILKLIGVNSRFSAATPEEIEDTLGYMEDWMAANSATGRRIGWNESPDSAPNPNDETGIPNWAVMGVTGSVATYACSYFEKPITPAIMKVTAMGMGTISARTAEVQEVQYPTRMPRGGNSNLYRGKFYPQPERIRTFNDFLTDEGDEPITSP